MELRHSAGRCMTKPTKEQCVIPSASSLWGPNGYAPAECLSKLTSHAIERAQIGRVSISSQGLEVDFDRFETICSGG